MPVAVVPTLDPGWLEWVAENLLRSCSRPSMLQAMAEAGVPAAQAEATVDAVAALPISRAARQMAQRLAKLESVAANLQAVWQMAPNYATVERRAAIGADQLLHDHVIGQRPVVLTDLARDWPALRRWTPEYLHRDFGEVLVEVQAGRDTNPNYELNKLQLRLEMRLAEFIDRVWATGKEGGNDLYLTANNQALQRPGLAPLLGDVGSLPDYIERSQLPGAALLWLGSAGTRTPLHHDTVMLMHTQIVGRKRWHLVSPLETAKLDNSHGVFSPIDLEHPDLVRWPAMASVKILDVTVEAGETLFVPLGWWHQVRSLDLCISVSFTNFVWPNRFAYRNAEGGV